MTSLLGFRLYLRVWFDFQQVTGGKMDPKAAYFFWVTIQSLQLICVFLAVAPALSGSPLRGWKLAALSLCVVGAVVPISTLLLFTDVFVIGGSSNVAQIAGEGGFALWAKWCDAWPYLFFGNPIAFLITIVATVIPPYPPKEWASFLARLSGIAAAAMAWYMTVRFFPDA